jgi:hypothetical protein
MVGWVVLCRNWVEWTEEALRADLDRVYPGEFLPPRRRDTFVVSGPVAGTQFLLHSAIAGATGMFLLNSVPRPYTDFSPFADRISDLALRRHAVVQRAWLGLERIGGTSEADAGRFIGKVLAALAPADASVLVHPARLMSFPFDAELRLKLSKAEVD